MKTDAIHPDSFREYMMRDLLFLQGVAAGLSDSNPNCAKQINARTEVIKLNMKRLMLSLFPDQDDTQDQP